jgi:hypothetical protein
MTILSTEPRVNGFHRAAAVIAPSSALKDTSPYFNSSLSIPAHTTRRFGPSTLLSKFIEQFNELEAYKYIDSPFLCNAPSDHYNSQARQGHRH